MKFCPRCGAEAADAQKFCTRCGQPLGPLSGATGTAPVTESAAQPGAPPVVHPVPATDRGSAAAASDPGGIWPRISRRTLVAAGIVLALLVTGVTIALSNNGTAPSSCSDAIKASDAAGAKVANYEGPVATSCASLADFMSAYDLHPQDHTYSPSAVLIFATLPRLVLLRLRISYPNCALTSGPLQQTKLVASGLVPWQLQTHPNQQPPLHTPLPRALPLRLLCFPNLPSLTPLSLYRQ